jgi:hypothetical protein
MTLWVLLAACTPESEATSTGDSETDTDTSGTDSEATPTDGGEVGDQACLPGKVEACPCVGGGQGVQTCNPDGNSYGACDCPDPTAGSASGDASTTGEPPDETTAVSTITTSDETTTDVSASEATTTTGDDTTTDGPPGCEDPDDAPADEEDAVEQAEQGCNDEPTVFSGVLAGDGDVDWFTYHGSFGNGCFGQPDVLHNLNASDNMRLCAFVDCDVGEPAFQCEGGSQMNMSPDGLPGCCDDTGVTFTLNCMGGPESSQVFVRLDMAEADACVEYSVEYSYAGGF